jgi:hypothetical protein
VSECEAPTEVFAWMLLPGSCGPLPWQMGQGVGSHGPGYPG